MNKVVIDTNVFVSSFFGGNPRRVIEEWKSGKVTLCLSRDIVDEYIEVLARLGLERAQEIQELLSLFAQGFHCIFTGRTPKIRVVEEDPDDDKFIECAVALKADCIISGDKALLAVKNYMGIEILNPRNYLDSRGSGGR
ncbi:MAG TPA: putative toxin-antitoxin system toxin component, PIN family [Deltaproteobacteria bacterium]|nr:putative toxin-antitoxin system toxin component, PIN family [Deltaproteobacteria bacterium]